jgi:hypothetical protein
MDLLVNTTGALVRGASFRMMPGSKKSSGEMVLDALMPPQPANSSGMTGTKAKRRNFQRILTCRV